MDAVMYGKERVNSKKKRLFATSFVQNGKEKSVHFIVHPDKNKQPVVFAILANVALCPKQTNLAKISLEKDKKGKKTNGFNVYERPKMGGIQPLRVQPSRAGRGGIWWRGRARGDIGAAAPGGHWNCFPT
jgi:hypothetical protein